MANATNVADVADGTTGPFGAVHLSLVIGISIVGAATSFCSVDHIRYENY